MSDLPRDNEFSFECQTCNDGVIYDAEQMKSHLQVVHQLTIGPGTKKMVLHLDTARHAISTYDCEMAGVKFFKTSRIERESAYQLRKLKHDRDSH